MNEPDLSIDLVLDAYQRMAYEALHAELVFTPPRDPNWTPPSMWRRFRWRWIRRFERLASYRVVSMEDYSSRYDY